MMKLYLGLLLIGCATAQVLWPAKCPDVELVPDFDPQQYLGKWYDVEHYFIIFEATGKCITATYGANENGTVSVYNKQINILTNSPSTINGYAYPKTSLKSKLTVVFPSLPVQVEGKYWVLGTDYTSYAVVWSCIEALGQSARVAWILTRERHPSEAVLNKAYAVLDKNKISRTPLLKTNQKDCPE